MPDGLETWRTSGECCKCDTALGAQISELTGKNFEWARGSGLPHIQLSIHT
ncbi:hypothetical protein ABIG06_003421 [Bradyrhizobium sp. USDA 326]|uniref:Uncharacterized protein n=1 Tax=Bradyrhizobium yuanmingense TaxID=108015 RepID=A0A1C3XK17_9BRAD|nr:hypothetical protein IQ15_07551 [Bradyrhizobium yuanmingense]SCB52603.1 hypothetical protein GA0061099_10363 [Bradyrhizobium yuanmingense]